MIVEDVGGWHLTLNEPTGPAPSLVAGGVISAAVAGAVAVGSVRASILFLVVGVAVAVVGALTAQAARERTRLVLRRHGDQLWCEHGTERLWSAPIGEIAGVRIEGNSEGASIKVDRHELARWYPVPGLHDPGVCEALRARVLAEARASEREGDAPAALHALREGPS